MNRILTLICLLITSPVLAEGIVRQPGGYQVRDGKTLELGSRNVVLQHITAPPVKTSCLMRGKTRDCGLISRSQLMDLTVATAIKCQPKGNGQARCTAGGFDLSEQMVYTGWAVPTAGAPARYWKQMAGARARKRGFWGAEFTPAWTPQNEALERLP